MLYIILVSAFFSAWALSAGLFFIFSYKEKLIDKLNFYDENIAKEKHELNKTGKPSLIKILPVSILSLVFRLKFHEKTNKKLDAELIKADMPFTAEEMQVVKVFSSLAIAFLAYAIFKNYIAVTILFIITWNIPRIIIATRKKERIKQFDSQLNEGINIISNSLKAGYSFMQAIAVVTEETKDPFSKEFKKMLKEMSLGISEEETFKNLLERMESEDLRLKINAILIQKDIGGNMSEILDNIGETIRERQNIKNELKTLTAQGRLSGIIVSLIPVFLGLTIYLFNKDYIMVLFTNVGFAHNPIKTRNIY